MQRLDRARFRYFYFSPTVFFPFFSPFFSFFFRIEIEVQVDVLRINFITRGSKREAGEIVYAALAGEQNLR